MKIAIMQPYFFPYIGYWQLINIADTFVIYDDVNYIKQGYINRNSILLNNESHRFTLGAVGASSNKLINEVKVGGNINKLLKTIEQAYQKNQNFQIVFPVIYEILKFEENNLAKFLGNSLEKIVAYLEIDTNIIYSSDIEKDNTLKSQEKILNICQRLKATQYINAIGGQDLYDKEKFQLDNIALNFIQTEMIKYKQLNNEFIPFLSIIDVMMFNQKNEIKSMLNRYTLI